MVPKMIRKLIVSQNAVSLSSFINIPAIQNMLAVMGSNETAGVHVPKGYCAQIWLVIICKKGGRIVKKFPCSAFSYSEILNPTVQPMASGALASYNVTLISKQDYLQKTWTRKTSLSVWYGIKSIMMFWACDIVSLSHDSCRNREGLTSNTCMRRGLWGQLWTGLATYNTITQGRSNNIACRKQGSLECVAAMASSVREGSWMQVKLREIQRCLKSNR